MPIYFLVSMVAFSSRYVPHFKALTYRHEEKKTCPLHNSNYLILNLSQMVKMLAGGWDTLVRKCQGQSQLALRMSFVLYRTCRCPPNSTRGGISPDISAIFDMLQGDSGKGAALFWEGLNVNPDKKILCK